LCILLILGYIQEDKKNKSDNHTGEAKATEVKQGISNSTPFVTPSQFCMAPANSIEEPENKPAFNPFQITSAFINGESLIRTLSPTEIINMSKEAMSANDASLLFPDISIEKGQ
jgi:hypothetical protein